MGGNGEYIPHAGTILYPPPGASGDPIILDPGFGGGCVKTGPFKDMQVNLGPVALPNATAGPDGGLGYNPRCLKRDVGPGVALKFTNYTAVQRKSTTLPTQVREARAENKCSHRCLEPTRYRKLSTRAPRTAWIRQHRTSWRRTLHNQVSVSFTPSTFLANEDTVVIPAGIFSSLLETQPSFSTTDRLTEYGHYGKLSIH